MKIRFITLACVALCGAAPMQAQTLAARVGATAGNASVRFEFQSRDGVCGDGEKIIARRGTGDDEFSIMEVHSEGLSYNTRSKEGRAQLLRDCDPGPVRVVLSRASGALTSAVVTVGGQARSGSVDLGTISPQEAVRYLLDVAATAPKKVAGRMMFAATLANAETEATTGLIALTRKSTQNRDVRKDAVFWLSQSSEQRATDRLKAILNDESDDVDVRKSAVFAIGQHRSDDAINTLISTARGADERELRKDAVFWLGQMAADKATAGLTSILGDDSAEIGVREAAVFALSQQRSDEAVTQLINVAKSAKEPKLRRSAMFWLGQRGDDPRVLKLFQDILLKN